MEPGKRNKFLLIGLAITVIVAGVTVVVITTTSNDETPPMTGAQMAQKVLAHTPIIDGHNDFPWNLRNLVNNDLRKVNFSSDLRETDLWGNNTSSHTDLPRLRAGGVGAQFWVAYTSCSSQYKDSVEQTIEQIDVIKRLAANYSQDLQFATSTADIESAMANGKIASLIGVEGGHSIQSSFGVLRMLYELGTRYMTLTHSCNTPWADGSPVDSPNPVIDPINNGLSDFGLLVIDEMNRLGMMIDISHVSIATMKAALNRSVAPVIFSHSSAKSICNHHRNVPDDVLELTKERNSIIMVNFYSQFVKCNGSAGPAKLSDVVEHIEYIRNITGPDHIGIGGDFDGVDEVPEGLEDVSKYPALLEALFETGHWSQEDLEKLAGKNILRVFKEVERVRDELAAAGTDPQQDSLTRAELIEKKANLSCVTGKFPDDEIDKDAIRRRRSISDDFQEF